MEKNQRKSSSERDTSKATAAVVSKADEFAFQLKSRIDRYQRNGYLSLGSIAGKLADDEIEKPRGGYRWLRSDVKRLLERIEKLDSSFNKDGKASLARFFS